MICWYAAVIIKNTKLYCLEIFITNICWEIKKKVLYLDFAEELDGQHFDPEGRLRVRWQIIYHADHHSSICINVAPLCIRHLSFWTHANKLFTKRLNYNGPARLTLGQSWNSLVIASPSLATIARVYIQITSNTGSFNPSLITEYRSWSGRNIETVLPLIDRHTYTENQKNSYNLITLGALRVPTRAIYRRI